MNHLRQRRILPINGLRPIEIAQHNVSHAQQIPARLLRFSENTQMRLALLLILAVPTFAKVNFVRQVKPILEKHCVRCHGDERAMKHFRLDRREWAMRAITPNNPGDSLLYLAIKSNFMPPAPDKISPADLEILRKWIAEGARWPKNLQLIAAPR